jgi:hypothetical protein
MQRIEINVLYKRIMRQFGHLPEVTSSGVCTTNHKIYLNVTRQTIQMKASEVTASLKISLQDFKASNDWAERLCVING